MQVIPKDEVFSIEDTETRVLLITAYKMELVQFPEYSDPAWEGSIPARQFEALRIEIAEENGAPLERHYWIDSKRLIGLLLPLLERPGSTPQRYKITKFGIPPKSSYTVEPEIIGPRR